MGPTEWKQGGNYYRHGDYAIFYRDDGTGEALCCLHGFPTSSWDWRLIWRDLSARFRVVAPDLIGFGYSDKPRKYAYSIHDQATLSENLLQSLGITRIHILAHDYGDTVAQELLARTVDRERTGTQGVEIRSICFLNGGLFPEAHQARFTQKLLLSPLGPLVVRLISKGTFSRSFSALFSCEKQPSERELSEYWSLITYNDGLKIGHKLTRYMEERRHFRQRWVGALQQAPMPLRLINGPDDPVSGGHMVERYRELVPNADVVVLDGVGHYPQLEDPKGVVTALFEFVDQSTQREGGI